MKPESPTGRWLYPHRDTLLAGAALRQTRNAEKGARLVNLMAQYHRTPGHKLYNRNDIPPNHLIRRMRFPVTLDGTLTRDAPFGDQYDLAVSGPYDENRSSVPDTLFATVLVVGADRLGTVSGLLCIVPRQPDSTSDEAVTANELALAEPVAMINAGGSAGLELYVPLPPDGDTQGRAHFASVTDPVKVERFVLDEVPALAYTLTPKY